MLAAVWMMALTSFGKAGAPVPGAREQEPLADRESEPMPIRIDSMSAPTRSQNRANSFMKLIRVESMALAAYLAVSDERMSMM